MFSRFFHQINQQKVFNDTASSTPAANTFLIAERKSTKLNYFTTNLTDKLFPFSSTTVSL